MQASLVLGRGARRCIATVNSAHSAGLAVRAVGTHASPFSPQVVSHPTRKNKGGKNRDYLKFKHPKKTAKALLEQIEREYSAKLVADAAQRFVLPDVEVGDAAIVKYRAPGTDTENFEFKGVVIEYVKNGQNTRIRLINRERGVSIERSFLVYSPWTQGIVILEKRFGTRRNKRSRRAKLGAIIPYPQRYSVTMREKDIVQDEYDEA